MRIVAHCAPVLYYLSCISVRTVCSQVLPGLYVSGLREARDKQLLTEAKITHVLSVYDDARESPIAVCLRIHSNLPSPSSSFLPCFLFYDLLFPCFHNYKSTRTRVTSYFNFLFLDILVSFDFINFKHLFSFINFLDSLYYIYMLCI